MALCGYNDKIGKGLELFFEGMVESLREKALKMPTQDVLEQELIELENMISVLETAPGDTLAEMFGAINSLALALFVRVQSELRDDETLDMGRTCVDVGRSFIELLARTQAQNEHMPLPEWTRAAIALRARTLASWALEQNSVSKESQPVS